MDYLRARGFHQIHEVNNARALATDATLDKPHGLSMGLYRLFGDIGFVVGPIILGMIADDYGLRMPFTS